MKVELPVDEFFTRQWEDGVSRINEYLKCEPEDSVLSVSYEPYFDGCSECVFFDETLRYESTTESIISKIETWENFGIAKTENPFANYPLPLNTECSTLVSNEMRALNEQKDYGTTEIISEKNPFKENKLFKCPNCKYDTNRKKSVKLHFKNKHNTERPYFCPYCFFVTTKLSAFSIHVEKIHPKEILLECDQCEFRTDRSASLTAHKNSKHRRSMLNICPYCKFVPKNKSYMNRHINVVHTKDLLYLCQYCEHKTAVKGSLLKHINARHTQTAIFNCDKCKYKTTHADVLKRHINGRHEKKFFILVNYEISKPHGWRVCTGTITRGI